MNSVGIILDTETTGIVDPVAIEVAWMRLVSATDFAATENFHQYYNPGKPISFGAMATHHITNEDVANCLPISEFIFPENVGYIIGHNVDFDWNVLGKPDVKRICTLALARKAWPDADSHTQSALMYMLCGPSIKRRLRDAHSAKADIGFCMHILSEALRVLDPDGGADTWESLWELSEAARIPDVIAFGKHKGTPIKDLPSDYVAWLKRQPDIDPYLMTALNNR